VVRDKIEPIVISMTAATTGGDLREAGIDRVEAVRVALTEGDG
jgi:hypothetical protein